MGGTGSGRKPRASTEAKTPRHKNQTIPYMAADDYMTYPERKASTASKFDQMVARAKQSNVALREG